MQIGNCVGASNHRHFITFLISAVLSTMYISFICIYAGLHIWPSLTYQHSGHLNGHDINLTFGAICEVLLALFRSAVLLSARGLVLVYLLVFSVTVEIGLSILLWQQLSYIYEGQTYLSHLSSPGNHGDGEKDCQNLLRFFGCSNSFSRFIPFYKKKIHEKWIRFVRIWFAIFLFSHLLWSIAFLLEKREVSCTSFYFCSLRLITNLLNFVVLNYIQCIEN